MSRSEAIMAILLVLFCVILAGCGEVKSNPMANEAQRVCRHDGGYINFYYDYGDEPLSSRIIRVRCKNGAVFTHWPGKDALEKEHRPTIEE